MPQWPYNNNYHRREVDKISLNLDEITIMGQKSLTHTYHVRMNIDITNRG